MSFNAPLTLALLSGAVLAACTANTSGGIDGASAGPNMSGAGTAGINGTSGASGMSTGTGGSGNTTSSSCGVQKSVSTFHRINRVEYQNSVNQLLGTKLPLADALPVDSLVNGFDNNADVSMSATLMEKYMNAAQSAVTAALKDPAARASLIPCTLSDVACQRSVIQGFLTRAFRRPPETAEVDKYLGYVQVCKSSLDAGIGCSLQAALISSKFLFRGELLSSPTVQACTESAPLVAQVDGKLSGYALASRLSYFVTSSGPDSELITLAQNGTLNDPAVIGAQVDRLIAPDASAKQLMPFIDNFPTQWLQISAAQAATPSKTLYPNFDDPLRKALGDEGRLFFKSFVADGGSALDLVRTNYTFLNERLASHYGINGVTGSEMRRVDTTGTKRGGILTQAAYLTATSSSENTSIVQRAKWVLTNLLCSPLPAPAPGLVDSVPPPDPGLGLTNRESLSIRTANQPCAGCHKTINPIGFAFETYGATGEPRTMDHGKPVDSSGMLPTGESFTDTEGLFSILKNDPRFPVCMTEKVLVYALGRSMDAACDEASVKALAEQWKTDNYNLKNQIKRIAQSDIFRSVRQEQVQ